MATDLASVKEQIRTNDKAIKRFRKQGRDDEADQVVAENDRLEQQLAGKTFDTPRDASGRLNPGAAAAKATADAQRRQARTAAAETVGKKPLSDQQEQRRKERDRKALDMYVRANGNMSVNRRLGVVSPALVQLGYTKHDADRIAIDAPLNAAMYNDQAVRGALRYAWDITPERIGLNPNAVASAIAPGPIEMPVQAQRALEQPVPMPTPAKRQLMQGDRGMQARSGFAAARRLLDDFGQWVAPLANKMGNAPVPGGLGGLFLLNLGFLFLIVPANAQGFTRAQLLYGLLMGRVNWANGYKTPAKDPVMDNALFVDARAVAQGVADISQDVDQWAGGAAQAAHTLQGVGNAFGQGVAAGVGALIPGVGSGGVATNTTAVTASAPATTGVGGGPVGGGVMGNRARKPGVNTDYGPRPRPSFRT